MLQIFFNMLSSLVYDRTHMIVCQWIEHGFSFSSALNQFVLFQDPELSVEKQDKKLVVRSRAYAKNVELIGADGDLRLSDNFFDMEAGEYTVDILEGDAQNILCRSVFDIA